MATVAGEGNERAVVARRRSRFFANAAIAMAVVAVVSFSFTYFRPLVRGDQFDPLRHLHGAVFFAWMALYVWQAGLVAAGRVRLHRELGIAVIALSGAMVPLGQWMAVRGIEDRVARGDPRPFEIALYNLVDLALFAGCMAAATWFAPRRNEWHRRFVYVAAICLLGPALSRLTGLLPLGFPWLDAAANLTADLFLAALAVHDVRALGRIHPVTIASALVLVPFNLVEPLLARSAAWNAFAPHLYGFG